MEQIQSNKTETAKTVDLKNKEERPAEPPTQPGDALVKKVGEVGETKGADPAPPASLPGKVKEEEEKKTTQSLPHVKGKITDSFGSSFFLANSRFWFEIFNFEVIWEML